MDYSEEFIRKLDRLIRKVDRIDVRLAQSIAKPEKKTWVKVKMITTLTGWNREELRAARENKTILWKKDSNGIWYLLESIPEQLIKNQAS